MTSRETFAIITGGGTSGHVLPAMAIADGLVASGHAPTTIHYVGGRYGVESTMLANSAYPTTFLDVVGLQRNVSKRNLTFVPKLIRSVRAATRLIVQLRPAVVVNVGGYASFPATYAARRRGVPYVVVSWDRRPGLVSRLLASRAAACAVASEGSELPNAVLTGAPVRAEMIALDRTSVRARARQRLALPADRFIVAVVCGSLGAGAINEVVAAVADRLGARTDLAIYHVVGDRFLSAAAPSRDGESGILYRVVGYEADMVSLYAAADLFITRAGAGTLAELTTVGAPAIVVPWPDAAENHQVVNATLLAEQGAVMVIEQSNFTPERLVGEIDRYSSEPAELATLANRARAAGEIHRSGKLIALIEEVATR